MIKVPRGTQDILPEDSKKWRYIEDQLDELTTFYNYKEIRAPIFESANLFVGGVDNSTNVVQKEIYTFKDEGDRSTALRPEGTAVIVRSYIEHKMQGNLNRPIKPYYNGPMSRYECKQKGRYRQFNQSGIEAIDAENPSTDAEVLAMIMHTYQSSRLKCLKLVINSVGDMAPQKEYDEVLVKHFEPVVHKFCSDCQSRLHINPMRTLDCKADRDKEAIKVVSGITDFLNEESKAYYEQVKAYLDGLGIPYIEGPNLVRGLDYYTRTAFELIMDDPNYDGAITIPCGGGRCSGLLKLLDGPGETGIGFALSIERLLLALEEGSIELDIEENLDLSIVTMSDQAGRHAMKLLNHLRHDGIKTGKGYLQREIKGQMKQVDRSGARFTIAIGDQELENNRIDVKNMIISESETIESGTLVRYFKRWKGR